MSPAAAKVKNVTEIMRGIDWSVIDRMRTGSGGGSSRRPSTEYG